MKRHEYIQHIIQTFHFKTKNEADRFLKLHYETTFNIIDHRAAFVNSKIEPNAQLRHPGMHVGGYDVIERLLREYEEFRVYEITHMSFLDFCCVPKPAMLALKNQCLKLGQLRDKNKADLDRQAQEEWEKKNAITRKQDANNLGV